MKYLEEYKEIYSNTEKVNDFIWIDFANRTNDNLFLKNHRDYVEAKKLGFGDRSFHYMWYLLVQYLLQLRDTPDLLEIGVYKGQVISLWALIAAHANRNINIHAVSPFEGNSNIGSIPNSKIYRTLRAFFSKNYRHNMNVGNLHPRLDYLSINRELFSAFNLDFNDVNVVRGYSNEENVLKAVYKRRYDLVYIDGDHRYLSVKSDIKNYAPLIRKDGILVMDDASFFLPGKKFWKGYKEVSLACLDIDGYGFKNILNVGHNRVYQKT